MIYESLEEINWALIVARAMRAPTANIASSAISGIPRAFGAARASANEVPIKPDRENFSIVNYRSVKVCERNVRI